MAKKNYKSDFDFILRLIDCNGNDIGVPDYDWVAHFYTISKTVQFTASCINGIYTNCFDDNGQLHIICNNHSLPCGSLQCEFIADIPNAIYPDGSEKIVSPQCVDIELVKGKGDCATSIEVQLQLPMLKGAPFTYDDFTPEQLEQLKGPQGNPGKDGASAYDQALAGGYTGTEQEFIESLSQINEMVRHESTDNELEAIEPNIATDALRKTEQLLTEAEQNQVLKNLGNPERQLFDDMWISAGNIDGRQYSSIDHENHPYTPYILNDIFHTYEEAVYTFIKTAVNYEADLISMFNGDKKLKTNFPIPGGRLTDNNSTNMFNGCSSLEVVVVSTNYCNPNKASNWFNGCTNLREIRGLISYSYANYSYWVNTFKKCYKLEEFRLQLRNGNLSFADSPLLSFDTVSYMANNKPSSITGLTYLTVHPDVYAKLTGDTTNAAAAALSVEELAQWTALIEQAAAKNIQFATA